MITSAQQSIFRQRDALTIFLKVPLGELASVCGQVWSSMESLEDALHAGLKDLPYCDHIYAMDLNGIQLTARISAEGDDRQNIGLDRQNIGLDRSMRPYMNNVVPLSDFILPEWQ